jgi:hypoxanthine phosphoribosyltransferase
MSARQNTAIDLSGKLSLGHIKHSIALLGETIRRGGFSPTLLVAVARGGWVPVRLFSNVLGTKEIVSIGIKYGDQKRSDLVTYSIPHPFPRNERVLVVEDHLESGRSLKFAKQVFEENNNEVRTAALYVSDQSIFVPDYFCAQVTKTPHFPWE